MTCSVAGVPTKNHWFGSLPMIAEEMMYRSATLTRECSDDLTIVTTFTLLGLALSLLAIGKGGFNDAGYMADLFLLFFKG
jgi:hypothetical protein